MKKSFGVLAPVFSLGGKYGIGTFGEESYRFTDFLAKSGAKVWQTLPLCQTVFGDSPYQTTADCSFNPYFTDLDDLFEQGLLLKSELTSAESENKRIDYGKLYRYRIALLKKAFSRFDFSDEFVEFVNGKEFDDYALFMALKDEYGSSDNFPEEYKKRDKRALSAFKEKNYENYLFYVFTQFTLKKQYGKLKKYANERGIKIMGDLPLYVARDSAEVWKEPEVFALDKDMKPTLVAGVPPDYFSADGQLWGNPVYDYENSGKAVVSFFKKRIKRGLDRYDLLRIDHFRGLASYWSVPYGSKTAKNGEWKQGPGMKLFDAIKDAYSGKEIIAEDLGAFGEDVKELLESTGLPGIRVIQFAFQSDSQNEHLPHNYDKNTVACLGTHDNNTLLGWLYEIGEGERRYALDYCGFSGGDWGEGGYYAPACRKIIETVWRSSADTVIIAFQDLCGFGSDARMNIPGVPELNWRIRTTQETINNIDKNYFRKINGIYGR